MRCGIKSPAMSTDAHRSLAPSPWPGSVPAENAGAKNLPSLVEHYPRHQVLHHPLVKLPFPSVLLTIGAQININRFSVHLIRGGGQ